MIPIGVCVLLSVCCASSMSVPQVPGPVPAGESRPVDLLPTGCRLASDDSHGGLRLDCANSNITSQDLRNLSVLAENVTTLILDENPILTLRNRSFRGFIHLAVLSLINCQLDRIELHAFHGLGHLKELYLETNHLRFQEWSLPFHVFDTVSSLAKLTLHGNVYYKDSTTYSESLNIFKALNNLSYLSMDSFPDLYLGHEFAQLRQLRELFVQCKNLLNVYNNSLEGLENSTLKKLTLDSASTIFYKNFDTGVFKPLPDLDLLSLQLFHVGNHRILQAMEGLVKKTIHTLNTFQLNLLMSNEASAYARVLDSVIKAEDTIYLSQICVHNLNWASNDVTLFEMDGLITDTWKRCLVSIDFSMNKLFTASREAILNLLRFPNIQQVTYSETGYPKEQPPFWRNSESDTEQQFKASLNVSFSSPHSPSLVSSSLPPSIPGTHIYSYLSPRLTDASRQRTVYPLDTPHHTLTQAIAYPLDTPQHTLTQTTAYQLDTPHHTLTQTKTHPLDTPHHTLTQTTAYQLDTPHHTLTQTTAHPLDTPHHTLTQTTAHPLDTPHHTLTQTKTHPLDTPHHTLTQTTAHPLDTPHHTLTQTTAHPLGNGIHSSSIHDDKMQFDIDRMFLSFKPNNESRIKINEKQTKHKHSSTIFYIPKYLEVVRADNVGHTIVTNNTIIIIKNAYSLRELYMRYSISVLNIQGRITGLNSLKLLDFTGSRLVFNERFFQSFPNLTSLVLKQTQRSPDFLLTHHGRSLLHNKQLEYLDLSHNSLKYLPGDTFLTNVKLRYLCLASNRFTMIPFRLSLTPSLEILDLRNNALASLSLEERRVMDAHQTKVNNFTVLLAGNVPVCTCSSRPFLMWLRSTAVRFDHSGNYSCLTKDGSVSYTLMASTADEDLRRCEGRFCLMLSLTVLAVMVAVYTIAFFTSRYHKLVVSKILRLVAPGFRILTRKDFAYDVFIGYADQDVMLVRYGLLPMLEDRWGLRTFVRHRDLRQDLLGQRHAARDSWRCLLILSYDFLLHTDTAHDVMKTAAFFVSAANLKKLVVVVEERQKYSVPDYVLHVTEEDNIIVVPDLDTLLTAEVLETLRHRLTI